MLTFNIGGSTLESRRRYWAALGWELVVEHNRSRPYMAWSGIRDVFVREYVRRPRNWRYRWYI